MYELLSGLGLALPAGLNAYIPLLGVALADRYTGLLQLAAPYDIVSSPGVILLLVALLLLEVIADKVPVIDHFNDVVQTAVRPASGAIVMMATTDATGTINPVVAMSGGLLLAGTVHFLKASFRTLVTASTGGIGNPIVSSAEDGAAIGLTLLALIAPIAIAVVLILLLLAVLWVLRRRRFRRSMARA